LSYSVVYFTAKDPAQAKSIAHTAVYERLAACANCFSNIGSVYRWQGIIEETTESACLLKTKTVLVEKLTERIKSLHSYEVPCIVSWKISTADRPFLNWIDENTIPPQP
jgi:periplasmic divalent cation tolerance protein